MPWQIDRPRPVPTPLGLLVQKGSKTCSSRSGSMPLPVSSISTNTRSGPAAPVRMVMRLCCASPSGMAWAALTSRLTSTCTKRVSLPITGGMCSISRTSSAR